MAIIDRHNGQKLPLPSGNGWTCILPPGRYYIGDTRYFLKGCYYDYTNDSSVFVFEDKSKFYAVARSTGADGSYEADDGREYSVDSASLGICSIELGSDPADAQEALEGALEDGTECDYQYGTLHEFKSDIICVFYDTEFTFMTADGKFKRTIYV